MWTYKETPGAHVYRGTTTWRSQRPAPCKPKRDVSEETNPASTLILDFQLPKLWGKNQKYVKATQSEVFCADSASKLTQQVAFVWTEGSTARKCSEITRIGVRAQTLRPFLWVWIPALLASSRAMGWAIYWMLGVQFYVCKVGVITTTWDFNGDDMG